jgi:Fe2+ or Zn2+ uptake regulation protein
MAVTKPAHQESRSGSDTDARPADEPLDDAARLRGAGLRVTLPRLAVLRTVGSSSEHVAADEIRALLASGGIELQRSSVFNVLGTLAEAGLIRRVDLGGPTRFEPIGPTHDHFVCRSCRHIHNVAPADLPVPEVPGTVTATEVVYRGLCDGCAAE